ncbi:hypothetical protein [Ammoniphilus sp. YIM 78166]|uniref:hypothetical protein n=1 Tax=Ammoniphilus sp. YIM 78166 TaxID=1644106 RepID=UPI00106FF18D|nr:hypothetical protein [Ammoniphilus sp. YIM 78166]
METYEVMEYTNITLQFERVQIERLIEAFVEAGLPISWKETKRYFTLSVQTTWTTQRLTFDKYGNRFKLKNKSYNIKDQKFAKILQHFILEVRGHAILKLLSNEQLVVQNIRYGEPIRIIEIKGPNKKILFEKECIVTMEQVIEAIQRKDAEERIPVLKMELDYELSRLFEAMEKGDVNQIESSKQELEKLRVEMLLLEI